MQFLPQSIAVPRIDVTLAVALLVDWAAQSNIAAVRVLHQLLEGTLGGDKDFQKVKKRLQYVKTKLKTYTMAEKAYSPESTNARLLSNFYLPDPPPLLTLKQQWKCDATVASLDAFAFIEPIHTDTALGMAIMEPCATATDTDTDTDNVDLGQCGMVGPVDLRDTFSTDTWFMGTTWGQRSTKVGFCDKIC